MSTPSDSGASTTKPTPAPDPEVKGFLALLAARRAPRTVDAYRRDLADLAGYLGRSPADASTDDLQGVARRPERARPGFYLHRQAGGRGALLLQPPRPPRPPRGQPCGRARPPAAPHAPPPHALARRGGAPDPGGERDDSTIAPRPRPRRAPLRSRAPGQRGRGARPRPDRPGQPRRAVPRQGGQGADRPARARRRRGHAPLPRPGTAVPRSPAPPGAFPQRAGRRADPGRRLPHPPAPGREGGTRSGPRASPSPPPFLRHAPPRRGRGPALGAGDARPRRPGHDRDLHPCFGRAQA